MTKNLEDLIQKRKTFIKSLRDNNFDFTWILGGLYEDPSHFIYEILQNAEDAKAKNVNITLHESSLEISNDGIEFDYDDVDSITGFGKSTKKDDLNKIGKFGVGFKSVYAISSSPSVHSGRYHFIVKDFVVPEIISDQKFTPGAQFIIPFNHDFRLQNEIYDMLADKLQKMGPRSLLFLNNIKRINWATYDDDGYYEFAAYVRERNKGLLTPRRRIAGFAMLLQRELYRDLGGLDEQFGSGNYEDDDLCVRLREQGLAIMVNEGIYLHHFGSKTFEHNKIDYTASLSRNSVLFREKWPHIDMDWLLEMDEPLLETLERESLDALTHIKSGDSDKGLQMCEAILAQNPLQVDALHALGMAAHLAGDSQAARELYEHVIQINEKWHGARESLAQLELEEKNILSAQVQLAAILKIDETHQSARRLLAQCFLAEEKFQEAVSLLMGLIGDFPKDWQSHLILATLYAEIEQVDQAKGHLELVLASNPGHTEAKEWLARLEDRT
ncbi:MAG: tetratricopeptide repeat protein [Candidatus Marinimicrobia bacterium]|nr:tetratricopeptide repeat protein [Candidatus Neomarinimicrobiota bacterium]